MLPQTGNIGDKTVYHCRRTSQKCAAYEKKAIRKFLTRLRISCHRLLIETGHYSIPKIPAEDRLCKFCNLDQVEYKMHLISISPLYQQNREILYQIASKESKHFPYLSNRNKFTWLIDSAMKLTMRVCSLLLLFLSL